MVQPLPTIANGGRQSNGALTTTVTRPVPTQTKKQIKQIKSVEVTKKKTWPHKGNTLVITLFIGLAIGGAISYFLFWLPYSGPHEDVGHTGMLIGWTAVLTLGIAGILWFLLSLVQRATDEYKD